MEGRRKLLSLYALPLKYRNEITYVILSLVVIYAWWVNVISVYITRWRRVDSGTINADAIASSSREKIVVLSCNFQVYENPSSCLFDDNCGCSYWLPVAALAWRRFGYKSLVLTVGQTKGKYNWQLRRSFYFGLSTLKNFGGVTIQNVEVYDRSFMEHALGLSRIFAVEMVENIDEDPYIIFADPNMLPFAEAYFEPENMDGEEILIVSRRQWCCKRFLYKGSVVKLLPSGSMVGMRASIWKQVIGQVNQTWVLQQSKDDDDGDDYDSNKERVKKTSIPNLNYLFEQYFDGRDLRHLSKNSYENILLSILINEWLKRKGATDPKDEKSMCLFFINSSQLIFSFTN